MRNISCSFLCWNSAAILRMKLSTSPCRAARHVVTCCSQNSTLETSSVEHYVVYTIIISRLADRCDLWVVKLMVVTDSLVDAYVLVFPTISTSERLFLELIKFNLVRSQHTHVTTECLIPTTVYIDTSHIQTFSSC